MSKKGWYTMVGSSSDFQTRWLSINDFWINGYQNMKDVEPLFSVHVSKLEIQDGFQETKQMHSVKLIINHNSAIGHLFIYTPNQFDIKEIRERILDQQKEWESSMSASQPELPQTFTVDQTGKFIFKAEDRIAIQVDSTELTIHQQKCDDIKIPLNQTFDTHPLLEPSSSNWISIISESNKAKYHFEQSEKMRSFVNLTLHCQYQNTISLSE